nr:hypothetical protein CFP56_13271 [Quercus suber]
MDEYDASGHAGYYQILIPPVSNQNLSIAITCTRDHRNLVTYRAFNRKMCTSPSWLVTTHDVSAIAPSFFAEDSTVVVISSLSHGPISGIKLQMLCTKRNGCRLSDSSTISVAGQQLYRAPSGRGNVIKVCAERLPLLAASPTDAIARHRRIGFRQDGDLDIIVWQRDVAS